MAGRIRNIVRKSSIYRLISEFRGWQMEKERFLQEARSMTGITEEELRDYIKAMRRYRISPSEYFHQYRFKSLDSSARDAFITRSEMQKVYRRLVTKEIRLVFQNKPAFLQRFAPFIKRRWVLAESEADHEALKSLLSDCDVIVKPIDGALGSGIYKLTRTEAQEDMDSICRRLVKENVLVEECVRAIDEIEDFHLASLNTIRVVTFSNEDRAEIIGAFVRFGCHGSVVDNAHAGGIFATIDVKRGVIISNGLDTDGNEYEYHPDSHKTIKGFVVPPWEKVVSTCIAAARFMSGVKFAGWDCVVLPDGEIDILEGNHGPDVDVMQSPLKVGIRSEIKDKLKSFFNYNL